ncbi:MAG: cupin domain-containing protein [Gemmatimonadota bacterium]|nr:cupin domain-containing protein [Gemmatimonadota bacterium]
MSTTADGPFIRTADTAWHVVTDGVRRQVLGHGTDLMIVRVEFRAGAVGALHHHPHRQASYVESGRFDVTVGDDMSRLVAGDCFYAPADVPHGVHAIEDGVLIDIFTPIREDFLNTDT